jgi:DNA-binding Xre family transcriptional regulator
LPSVGTAEERANVPTPNQSKLDGLSSEQRARVEAIRARRGTSEAQAEIERVRQRFADHPSRVELIRCGEIDPKRSLTGDGRMALTLSLAKLNRLRSKRGLSLADVADRCGLDRAAISRLESGKNPNLTFETVARYAPALGVRIRVVVEEA